MGMCRLPQQEALRAVLVGSVRTGNNIWAMANLVYMMLVAYLKLEG